MEGITYIEALIEDPDSLFKFLIETVDWDDRMQSRKTASFGKPYNYSQIEYPEQAFPDELVKVIDLIESSLRFRPNNCLINYYLDGKSKMGWHSDRTDILASGTGVAIVSIGDTRVLSFREIEQKENKVDFSLPAGSIIYMTDAVQEKWHHSIPKADSDQGRISLTFRELKD